MYHINLGGRQFVHIVEDSIETKAIEWKLYLSPLMPCSSPQEPGLLASLCIFFQI